MKFEISRRRLDGIGDGLLLIVLLMVVWDHMGHHPLWLAAMFLGSGLINTIESCLTGDRDG